MFVCCCFAMHAVWRASVFGNNQVARCLAPSPLNRPVTASFVTTLISNQMYIELVNFLIEFTSIHCKRVDSMPQTICLHERKCKFADFGCGSSSCQLTGLHAERAQVGFRLPVFVDIDIFTHKSIYMYVGNKYICI